MTRAAASGAGDGKSRLAVIDAMRGLAANSVMFYHFFGYFRAFPDTSKLSRVTQAANSAASYGYLGVQVFFVISGFVIALARPRVAVTPKIAGRFFLRRMVRLWPPYLVSLLAVLLVHLLSATVGHGKIEPTSLPSVISHVFFLQDLVGYEPLQPIYWTICLEVQFYLFFALILVFDHACNPRGRASVAWHLAPYVGSLVLVLCHGDLRGAFFPFWYAFALGSILRLSEEQVVPRAAFSVCWFGLAAVLLIRWQLPALVVLFASAILYVVTRYRQAVAGFTESRLVNALAAFGRISYSLYLIHSLIGALAYFRLLPRILGSEPKMFAFIALATAVSVAAATLMYRFVEAPAVKLSHRLRDGRTGVTPGPIALSQDA